MFTTCPECGTVFRVSTAQLRMAEGHVRCGHCAATFNALASLRDEATVPPAPAAATGWTGRYAGLATVGGPGTDPKPAAEPVVVPESIPESIPGSIPESAPEHISEPVPGQSPAHGPAHVPQHVADETPDNLPEDTPGDTPDYLPEDIPDDMPDDVPADVRQRPRGNALAELVPGPPVPDWPAAEEPVAGSLEWATGLASSDDASDGLAIEYRGADDGADHGDGDEDEPGSVYVIEDDPAWRDGNEPALARAVAPVFGSRDDDSLQDAVEHADWESLLGEVDDDAPATPVYVVEGETPPAGAAALPGDLPEPAATTAGPGPADGDAEGAVEDDLAAAAEGLFAVDVDADADLGANRSDADDVAASDAAYELASGPHIVLGTDRDTEPGREELAASNDDADDFDLAVAAADAGDATADQPILHLALPDADAGAGADGEGDAATAPPDPFIVVDEDDAGPVVVLADEADRIRPGLSAMPAAADGPATTVTDDAESPAADHADDPDWPRFDPDKPPWDPPPESRPEPGIRQPGDFPPLWQSQPAWPATAAEPERRGWPWVAGSIVLALALALQFVVQQRDELATNAAWGGRLRQAFEAVGLSVYPAWNLSAYEVRGSEAVAGRTDPGALDVIATIAVTGPEPVGLPLVRVTLRDRWNEPLGTRVFTARDYLERGSTLAEPLAPGTLVPVRIRIADPGTDAFGYEVDVCLMDRRTGLTCQSEREPFRR